MDLYLFFNSTNLDSNSKIFYIDIMQEGKFLTREDFKRIRTVEVETTSLEIVRTIIHNILKIDIFVARILLIQFVSFQLKEEMIRLGARFSGCIEGSNYDCHYPFEIRKPLMELRVFLIPNDSETAVFALARAYIRYGMDVSSCVERLLEMNDNVSCCTFFHLIISLLHETKIQILVYLDSSG